MIQVCGGIGKNTLGYYEFTCSHDGCGKDPANVWRVSDSESGLNRLYLLCNEHDMDQTLLLGRVEQIIMPAPENN